MKNKRKPDTPATRPLSAKQQRFVAVYEGNATEAARKAGYSGDNGTLRAIASENLTKPNIIAAILEREEKRVGPLIANREARQEFWSRIMMDESIEMRDRLRGSELLGKSEGDFLERVEHRGSLEITVIDSFGEGR